MMDSRHTNGEISPAVPVFDIRCVDITEITRHCDHDADKSLEGCERQGVI